jgi:hypothetical protein
VIEDGRVAESWARPTRLLALGGHHAGLHEAWRRHGGRTPGEPAAAPDAGG